MERWLILTLALLVSSLPQIGVYAADEESLGSRLEAINAQLHLFIIIGITILIVAVVATVVILIVWLVWRARLRRSSQRHQ